MTICMLFILSCTLIAWFFIQPSTPKVVLRDIARFHSIHLGDVTSLTSESWMCMINGSVIKSLKGFWRALLRNSHMTFPDIWTQNRWRKKAVFIPQYMNLYMGGCCGCRFRRAFYIKSLVLERNLEKSSHIKNFLRDNATSELEQPQWRRKRETKKQQVK